MYFDLAEAIYATDNVIVSDPFMLSVLYLVTIL